MIPYLIEWPLPKFFNLKYLISFTFFKILSELSVELASTTIISFDSPNLFVTFKLDGGSTGWFKRETLRSGKVMLTSSLSIVAYLAGRYVKAVIA